MVTSRAAEHNIVRRNQRGIGRTRRDQQAPLTRQVGEQVGDEVAEGVRVIEDPLTVAGDGGAQEVQERLAFTMSPVGLKLRVRSRPAS